MIQPLNYSEANKIFLNEQQKKNRKFSLDTHKKSVRTLKKDSLQKKHQLRSLLFEMRRVSGGMKSTDKDYERGYTSISCCGRKPLNDINDPTPINVVRGKNSKNIYYNGLMKCGSVWRCPVCNYKITQQRGKEVYFMTSEFLRKSKDNKISFITLTMRHLSTYPLKYTLKTILEEFRMFQRTSVYKRLKEEHNIQGFIKSLEITVSDVNGWHPHIHLLLFHKSSNYDALHKEFIKRWVKRKKINALQKAQNAQICSNEKGIADYVTKWTISDELTKSNFKYSKKKNSFTPFQILRKISQGDFKNHIEEKKLKARFYEYSRESHGKHLIHISKNLQKSLKESKIKFELKKESEVLQDEIYEEILFKIEKPVFKEVSKYNLNANVLNDYESKGVNEVFKNLKNNLPLLELKYNSKLKLIYSNLKIKENETKIKNTNSIILDDFKPSFSDYYSSN